MIIGVDGSCLQGTRTGAGWYLTHLLEALSHLLEEDRIIVWMNNPTPEEQARVSENRFISVSATHYPWSALKMTWNMFGTPTMENLLGRTADICFYPNYLPLPQKKGKRVIFIHDLAYLTNPEWMEGSPLKNYKKDIEKQEEQADLILTCSEFNRNDRATLITIVKRTCALLKVSIDEAGAVEIAGRARGTPRVANNLINFIRDFAQERASGSITRDVANAALDLLEIDAAGLDEMDKRMLRCMAENYRGGPVGMSTIAVAVGEEAETLEEVHEPFLIQEGYLQRTPQGRILTERGYRAVGLKPSGDSQAFML